MKLRIVTNPDLDQPHHVVLVAGNGEPLMHSENYHNLSDAESLTRLIAEDTYFSNITIEHVVENKA